MIESDRDRESNERDPLLRARDRRWLDSALRDAASSAGSYKTAGVDATANQETKKGIPPQHSQSPLAVGDELEWWPEKVGLRYCAVLICFPFLSFP